MILFKKKELCIFRCATKGIVSVPQKTHSFTVGTYNNCDIVILQSTDTYPISATFSIESAELFVDILKGGKSVVIDGKIVNEKIKINDNSIHYIILNEELFYFSYSKTAHELISKIDANSFVIYNPKNGNVFVDSISFEKIKSTLESNFDNLGDVALYAPGTNSFIMANKLFNDINLDKDVKNEDIKQKIDEDFGELLCPSCWLHFSPEDINYISVHGSLLGDPLLGPDEKLRFVPVKYNASGMPLDPMGVPAHEMACPHCHRRLPSTFLQMKNEIISLVGAPSSGKSYYLCILLKYFPDILFKNFNIALVDADPPLNAVINMMKNSLFSSANSEDPYLAKTQLEGAMYDRLVRHGKMVSLPKPFVYILRDMSDYSNQEALTFYDNAGEHFEPNINIDDSPGSLHVASANAIMFLYDPLASDEIKAKVNKDIDPQLSKDSIDQQSIILAEMANRIKQIRNISNAYDLGIPMAFIVNKCDAIKDIFDYTTLAYPIKNGEFNKDIVDQNSNTIRELLLTIVPEIVINAEMISKNIKYFMVSPFGHSPRKIKKENGEEYIAPIISKIKPVNVEIPMIWALSQIEGTPLFNRFNKNAKNSMFTF